MARVPDDFDVDASVNEFIAIRVKTAIKQSDAIRENVRVARMADAAGYSTDWYPGATSSVDVRCKREDLPRIREVFGRMRVLRKYPGGSPNHITVILEAIAHPTLQILYETSIKPGSKCRVVETTRTCRQLACSV